MALDDSLQIKCQYTIRDRDKIPEIERQYQDAMLKLAQPVRCGQKTKNLFTWVIDQLQHSADYHLTERGAYAINICTAAAANKYDHYQIFTLDEVFK